MLLGCLSSEINTKDIVEKIVSCEDQERIIFEASRGYSCCSVFNEKIIKNNFFAKMNDKVSLFCYGDILKSPEKNNNKPEVVGMLESYLKKGDNFLDEFEGSYSLAIKDGNKLILVRDRFGTKPLYYLAKNNTIIFSSEIKAILKSGFSNKNVNIQSINNFFSYGYVTNPETMFKDIRQVKPGGMVIFDQGKIKERKYWDLEFNQRRDIKSEKEYIECFCDLFEKSVARCLKKFPDAGAFLSGGLDTSSVVGMMHKITGSRFKVFTAGFRQKEFNEIEEAFSFSRRLGLDHKYKIIDTEGSFIDLLKKLILSHEAPFSDTSAIPSFYVAELAKKYVNTVFTGDFPDQLIGGSGHQVQALKRQKNDLFFKKMLRNSFFNRIASDITPKAGTSSFTDRAKRFLYRETFPLEEQRVLLNMPVPPQLKRSLYGDLLSEENRKNDPINIARALYNNVNNESLLNKILYFDVNSYAPDGLKVKVNRMCALNGLNHVSPFHDKDLADFSASIPDNLKIRGRKTKYIMREAFKDILTDEILGFKKKGFAMPLKEWLISDFSEEIKTLLFERKTLERGLYDKKFFIKMVNNFFGGKTDYASGSEGAIISVLTVEIWYRLFLDEN